MSAKGRNKGHGQGAPGKQIAAQLAAEALKADEMAEEARKNREKAKADAQEREKKKQAAEQAASSAFVGRADVFEFAAETSFMQGRDELHMDRHVMVKDLVAASKALKMPIDSLDKPVALFSLYDGHFGPKCAEYCAQNFHKKLLPRLSKVSVCREQTLEEQIRASLVTALAELDQEFVSKFRTDRSGCCAQIALMTGRRLYVAGLGGDTQTLLCSSGGADDASDWTAEELHSPVLASCSEEVQRVEAAGGKLLEVAPDERHAVSADFEQRMREYRIQAASGLGCSGAPPMSSPFLRALGDRELKTPKAIVLPEPEVRTIWLEKWHKAFGLICDGITDVMKSEDVSALLQKHVGREKKAAGELTQEAYNRGSTQNLTAVTVYFRWPAKRSHDKAFTASGPAREPERPEKVSRHRTEAANPIKRNGEAAKAAGEMRQAAARDPAPAAQQVPVALLIEQCLPGEMASLEEIAVKSLMDAANLFQDEDGDVAHEFLEEDALGQLSSTSCLLKL
eukprot:TRINITY_DN76311_c0_g1_i1.p1 TRINITY_DN76311_c0_g1~~TRINITY_DN76311_c0_g1_i1.p1  ORF type:complete len:531 (+),score=133.66 TRINITY_DN76311_c0_g1_i1:65-1594(+)